MKPGFFTKKRIIASSIVLVAILLVSGGVYAMQMWDKMTNNQLDLFNQTVAPLPTAEETPTPGETPTPTPDTSVTPNQTDDPTATPSPTPTVDPLAELQNQADQSITKDVLHVLLIGVDYSEERVNNKNGEYRNKNFNSDVMLLLVINFKKNKVDMISFPRDTYAKLANIDGFYKLNYSLSAGGGINDKGFMNVCKSVHGILDSKIPPINYYIAVTMPAVKELTDAVGGVDYNVDVEFTIQGRHYKKGMQHLNGQAVLDYCRVRKGDISEQPGDLNRVNRQKKMLVAVFKKLQSTASILTVPKILTSMKDKTFTNLNFQQLAALALFGKDLPDKNITMRTLQGSEKMIFNYKYVLINQTKRVAMLKEVYGLTVAPQYKYAPEYARTLWAYMLGEGYLKEINEWLLKDAALDETTRKLIDPVANAQLAASMTATQELMSKFNHRLFRDSKPVFSASECASLETQVEKMRVLAQTMFYKAGYKADWHVKENKSDVFDMTE